MSEEKDQIAVSIAPEEWEIAKKAAEKECFTSPTSWIRHKIRVCGKGV